MPELRSPAEVAGGYVNVVLDGRLIELPTLKLKAERAWRNSLTKRLGDVGLDVDFAALRAGGDAAYEALRPLTSAPSDIVTDLVVSYDAGNALGGKEWLEEHADSAQLYAILKQILSVVFPFVEDLRGALSELAGLIQGGLWAQSSSTSGDLPTGTSDPSSSS